MVDNYGGREESLSDRGRENFLRISIVPFTSIRFLPPPQGSSFRRTEIPHCSRNGLVVTLEFLEARGLSPPGESGPFTTRRTR